MKIVYSILFCIDLLVVLFLAFVLLQMIDAREGLRIIFIDILGIGTAIGMLFFLLARYLHATSSGRRR